ncbi:MAG TPA: hypothetical protein VIB08_10395, partial [Thermoanaerobaculia bacterium]
MKEALPERTSGVGLGRRLALAATAALLLFGAGCGEGTPGAIAARVLARYQKATGAKPLTAGGMIRFRLAAAGGLGGAGSAEILWEPKRYRETLASAGWTTVRGIELGKAFFTDQDGVTRVVSDPVLQELTTRSYFWRRAWLFEDREDARVGLGAANDEEVSIRVQPYGGNPLELTFSRLDGRLRSARSPRFELEFSSETRFRDASDPSRLVEGEIAWVGLPTGDMPRPEVGGARARFSDVSSRIPFDPAGGRVVIPVRIGGEPVRLAVDATADGPVRVAPALASRLALALQPDIFGRRVAGGVALQVGSVTYPSLFVEAAEDLPPGVEAQAGGCFFREAVVELDPGARLFGLHDPERWVVPEGFLRVVIDDDGDRPVAILDRGTQKLRVVAGSDTGGASLELAAESARRADLEKQTKADGVLWGAARVAVVRLRVAGQGFFPDWGDDGRMGFPLLLRYHSYLHMPQR